MGDEIVSSAKKSALSADVPTKAELRNVIPAHCFERSLSRSLLLLLRDALLIGSLGMFAWIFLPVQNLTYIDKALWLAYGFAQGTLFFGPWVLAHECGHGAFSQYTWLNDFIGWVLHSCFLTPYFSWQVTHSRHHAKTGSLLDDEVFCPNTLAEDEEAGLVMISQLLGEDAFAVYRLFMYLVLGWPAYLLANETGPRRLHKSTSGLATMDHFLPTSKLFSSGARLRVALSTLGVLGVILALFTAGRRFGHIRMCLMYGQAYLWLNFWLVTVTWLHHTKDDVPMYGEGEWAWVKGALSTVDRPYKEFFGLVDEIHHHIGSTHVCHHLFSTIPCYHAKEATAALRAYLEPKGLYNYDGRSTFAALWETAKNCHCVDDSTGVQYYRTYGAKSKAL